MADFPFEDSGSFAAAFVSSFDMGFTGLAAGSPLISIFGGSGGGGGGIDIPLGATGGSDTCATYSRESGCSNNGLPWKIIGTLTANTRYTMTILR